MRTEQQTVVPSKKWRRGGGGFVTYAFNASTHEAKAGGALEFEASVGYVVRCLKTAITKCKQDLEDG